jgi:hypothetical protein
VSFDGGLHLKFQLTPFGFFKYPFWGGWGVKIFIYQNLSFLIIETFPEYNNFISINEKIKEEGGGLILHPVSKI